ncbi:S-layer homology domain-containing protein [Cohnella thermotolerans]|uniref:S-layer homology domain-containing protein n=1 Tax=Cohnella thermotolerans TaxID=329858 RepID=UPI000405EAF8|nr:S-layer homology domain-containing protein [Cohnella thermotolerans]
MALVSRGKSWISLIVLLALVWTGAAVPAPAASAASSTPFSDVASGHWAEKHIAKLALQGLVKGNNGLFKPNDSLSRQEAVVMAIRLMGMEDEVKPNDVVAFPSTFTVDNFFKPYVNFAFKQKLLSMTEEFALADKEPKKAWGSSPATREWVARLLVRAIGKDADAAAQSGKATSFADNASIDPELLGYINVAVGAGLVNGMDGNKFDPKGNLTRAAAATLFSRAESQIQTAYSGQVTGIWLSVGPDKLTMLHADGTTSTYTVSPATLFARADSEKLTTIDGLKVYGKALLISSGDGTAEYAEQLDDTAQVKSVEGKLVVVNSSKHLISILVGEDVQQYSYDENSPPAVTDADNNAIKLSDLASNADVKVIVDAFSASPKVLAVSLKTSAVSKSGTGTVTAVDADKWKMQVKDASTGVAQTLSVAETATVKKDGIYVDLSELHTGDTISYVVKNGEVTSIVVSKSTSSTTVKGYLFKVDKTDRTIQYTTSGDSSDIKLKFYTDDVTVSINNDSEPDLDDLYKDDAITMTLNDEGEVTAIQVTDRSIDTLVGAVVYSYSSNVLVVNDADGNPVAFKLDTATKYDLNGSTITKANAINYMTKGKKVNIGYSGSKLIYVSFVSKYSGTVAKNDTSAHQLKLTLDDGSSVTLSYGTPTVEIYGKSSASYSDVAKGNKVVVTLNSDQDSITRIVVNKTAQFDVVSLNASQNKINVTDSAGTTTEWTLDSSVSVLGEDGKAASLSAFTAGSALNATFEGKTLKSIKLVKVIFGKVTSVDAALGTVTVQSGSGTETAVQVGTSPIITKNGSTLSSLTSIAADDRVEIRKNESGDTTITVVTGTTKTVWYADATNLILNFKKATLAEEDAVKVSPAAYIHQGTSTLALGNLTNGDTVTVYVLRNKAVEIVKA